MIFYNSPKLIVNEVLEAFLKVNRNDWFPSRNNVDFKEYPLDLFLKKFSKQSFTKYYAGRYVYEFQYFTGLLNDLVWIRTDLFLRDEIILRKIEPIKSETSADMLFHQIVDELISSKITNYNLIIYGNPSEPFYCFLNEEKPKIYIIFNGKIMNEILKDKAIR